MIEQAHDDITTYEHNLMVCHSVQCVPNYFKSMKIGKVAKLRPMSNL